MTSPGTGPPLPAQLTLSDLVERTGVPASTIHHYRRNGLIPAPVRTSANRFTYDQCHVDALLEIRAQSSADHPEFQARIVGAAIEAFKTRNYSEVTVSEIADAAGMAKGNVYRYFDSKEELLTASIETLLDETKEKFGSAVDALGGIEGFTTDPDQAALVFGYLVADVLPMLLELGARAAKGHEPSADLGRKVLRTLAETVGQPFAAPDDGGRVDHERAIESGLEVIVSAFATVMSWAVGEDWPPDHVTVGDGVKDSA